MSRGGVRGVVNEPSFAVAKGTWALEEIVYAKLQGKWPSMNPYQPDSLVHHMFNMSVGGTASSPINDTFAIRSLASATTNNFDVERAVLSGDQTITTNTSWGSAGNLDSRGLAMRIDGNLTIGAGATLTATGRRRFLALLVRGNLSLQGTITMSKLGAASSVPAAMLLVDGQEIPMTGGNGAPTKTSATWLSGWPTSSNNGAGGGGGAGGLSVGAGTSGGAGSTATAWSGGSGGGGASDQLSGSAAASNGGAGGAGANSTSGNSGGSAGGAGNPKGAIGSWTGANQAYAGDDGTGGLLIIFVEGNLTIGASAALSADGGFGGGVTTHGSGGATSGGGSGGGSVNVFVGGVADLPTGTNIRAFRGGAGIAANNAYVGYPGAHGTSRYIPLRSGRSKSLWFGYTGIEQTWVVPGGVSSVTAWVGGASGSDNGTQVAGYTMTFTSMKGNGGLGGIVKATFSVTPGETLRIYVGEHGRNGLVDHGTAGVTSGAAFNGGATGGNVGQPGGTTGGGGGGATDIRQGGSALANRVLVAGGGGGGGGYRSATWHAQLGARGGDGGGSTGQTGETATGMSNTGGLGGTQLAGGSGGTGVNNTGAVGLLGSGGAGANVSNNGGCGGGGGGGGGYYGGGGGGAGNSTAGAYDGGGGGGGSNYIIGTATDTSSLQGKNFGHGWACLMWTE